MSRTDPTQAAREELAAAQAALAAGRLQDARRHLAEAERWGTSPESQRLRRSVAEAAQRGARQAGQSVWQGLAVAAGAYFVLGLQQPPRWTVPIWALLAFAVIPGVVGFLVGRRQGQTSNPKANFWKGFWVVDVPMFVYASIAMMVAHSRVGSETDAGQTFLAGWFVAVADAALAGAVAGLACALPTWRSSKGVLK